MLRFFFTEHLLMSLVFCQDSVDWCSWDSLWMEDDPSNIIFAWSSHPWDILLSRDKVCPFCIVGPEYYGKLGMVDPPMFPVNLWLCGCKPWISHNCFLLP